MELHQFTISKGKPYFNIPLDQSKDGVLLTGFQLDIFNPSDDLKVAFRKETKSGSKFSKPYSLLDFKEKYVNEKKIIAFHDSGENYILITLMVGITSQDGKFIELSKLDPDKFSDFKYHLGYKYQKEFVKV